MEEIEIVERLTKNESDILSLKDRVSNVEDTTKAIYDMNTNISLMIQSNKEVKKDIKDIKTDVTNLKTEVTDMKMQPAKDYKALVFKLIEYLLIFGLGYFLNLLIK